MVSLTDSQLAAIMNAARMLPVEKRDIFLQRIAAMLALRTRRYRTATTGTATTDTRRTISLSLRSNTQRDTRQRESHV